MKPIEVYAKLPDGSLIRLTPLQDSVFARTIPPETWEKYEGVPVFINAGGTEVYPKPTAGIELVTLQPFALRTSHEAR